MNVFVKPSAEPNFVRAMPRRENDERNSTFSLSRAQSGSLELPRRKTTMEKERITP